MKAPLYALMVAASAAAACDSDTPTSPTSPGPSGGAPVENCVSYPETAAWNARPGNLHPEYHGALVWDVLVENACSEDVLVYIKAGAWDSRNVLVAQRQWHYEPNFWERHPAGSRRWHCRDQLSGNPADDVFENACGLDDRDGRSIGYNSPHTGTFTITFSEAACPLGGPCREPPDPPAP